MKQGGKGWHGMVDEQGFGFRGLEQKLRTAARTSVGQLAEPPPSQARSGIPIRMASFLN